MKVLKGIAFGAAVVLTKAAIEDATRTRVSRQVPRWWRELGHLWPSRAWEAQAPAWARAMVWSAATESGVPAEVIAAVIHVESRWRADAVSSAGAIGLMQLMPATAASLGVNPWDLGQNVKGGARYLRDMLNHFDSTPQALAGYNAGPRRAAKIPSTWPSETRSYVASVLQRLQSIEGERLRLQSVVAKAPWPTRPRPSTGPSVNSAPSGTNLMTRSGHSNVPSTYEKARRGGPAGLW